MQSATALGLEIPARLISRWRKRTMKMKSKKRPPKGQWIRVAVEVVNMR